MKRTSAQPATDALLVTLAYELLDAHADTIELQLTGAGGLRWSVHLDYLRALHRAGEELLGHAEEVPAHAEEVPAGAEEVPAATEEAAR
jgi:hypothetical protein